MRQCGLVAWFYVETEACSSWPVCVRGASSPQSRPRDEPRRKELVDGLRQRLGIARAPVGRGEMAQVLLVRHVAEFDEHRGHVGRAQNDETCRLQRLLMQPRAALELVDRSLG